MMTIAKNHRLPRLAGLAVVVLFLLMLLNSAAWGQAVFRCVPSCAEDDSRFLSIPGPNLSTLTAQEINLQILIPADRADFELSVFDGDTGLKSPPMNDVGSSDPVGHWDLGSGRLFFDVFADPRGDGSGTILVRSLDGQEMADNAWTSATIRNIPDAQGKDGYFRYNLRVRLIASPLAGTISNFKLRILPASLLAIVQHAFGFTSYASSLDDWMTVYPNLLWPPPPDGQLQLEPTTYDGTFTFHSFVHGDEASEFVVHDGDLDHGSARSGTADSDDPDTPNDRLPAWFVPRDTQFEGAKNLGDPEDDIGTDRDRFGLLARAPSVVYTVTAPDGQIFENPNPSGNQEWEQFRVSTDAFDVTKMDHHADTLPGGFYRIDLSGLDIQNFNGWHADRTECVTSENEPCPPPELFSIGDTVFEDDSGDGNQDAGEPGIVGVLLNLRGDSGRLLDQAVTDGDGKYRFTVTRGEFTVEVDQKNFIPVGPAGSLGDRVFIDANRNGAQDAGEPGLSNVTVKLFDAGDNGAPGGDDDALLTTIVTDVTGRYRFNDLVPGTYFVAVEPGTLPAGLTLSPGLDPVPLRTITAAESFLDLDFGYVNPADRSMIGGQVWVDSNGTPEIRDPEEPGVGDVTVDLLDDATGFLVASTRTRGGDFLFSDLQPGIYRVSVTDLIGKLGGLTTSMANPTAGIPVAANEARLDIDFGYQGPGLHSVFDSVWLDRNRDGLRGAEDIGLPGASACLLDDTGQVIATTSSGADGQINVDGLPDGTYELLITDHDATLIDLIPTNKAALRGTELIVAGADSMADSFGYNVHGQLAGYVATTASPSQTNTVAGSDILTYDFGYANQCGECRGKVTELTLQYLGGDTDAQVIVVQKKPRVKIFSGQVQPGETFKVTGIDSRGTLGTEIKIYVNGAYNARIHTSCSRPVGPGLEAGDFVVAAGSSRHGGLLCAVDVGECKPDDKRSHDDDSSSDDRGDGGRGHHKHRSDDHSSDHDSSDRPGRCGSSKHGSRDSKISKYSRYFGHHKSRR